MIPKLILQVYPLNLENVKIGSLITDPLHPNEDIQNGSSSMSLETDCSASRTGPRSESIKESANTSLVVKILSSILGFLEQSATSTQRILADSTCTYELNNPTNRFKDLANQDEVQRWIQVQMEENQTIHLITGIQTTLNQRVETSKDSKLSTSASISLSPPGVPIGKILNKDGIDLDAQTSHSRSKDTELSLSTEGERVVAVRIRRVDVNEANAATLDQKNRSTWKMVGDQRAETSVEQFVEAILQDDDDDCGGTTATLNTVEGEERLVYVALEGSDELLH